MSRGGWILLKTALLIWELFFKSLKCSSGYSSSRFLKTCPGFYQGFISLACAVVADLSLKAGKVYSKIWRRQHWPLHVCVFPPKTQKGTHSPWYPYTLPNSKLFHVNICSVLSWWKRKDWKKAHEHQRAQFTDLPSMLNETNPLQAKVRTDGIVGRCALHCIERIDCLSHVKSDYTLLLFWKCLLLCLGPKSWSLEKQKQKMNWI